MAFGVNKDNLGKYVLEHANSPEVQAEVQKIQYNGIKTEEDRIIMLAFNDGIVEETKPTLTTRIAQALGINETITSPTFCLISEYYGKMPLYHMDVYRLEGGEDFVNLGTDDMIYGDGVSIIEWSEKIMEELPSRTIILRLTPQDDDSRLIEIENWKNGEI